MDTLDLFDNALDDFFGNGGGPRRGILGNQRLDRFLSLLIDGQKVLFLINEGEVDVGGCQLADAIMALFRNALSIAAFSPKLRAR
jgi:hypothetical protein